MDIVMASEGSCAVIFSEIAEETIYPDLPSPHARFSCHGSTNDKSDGITTSIQAPLGGRTSR